jgi:tryptophan-rich sensory protein
MSELNNWLVLILIIFITLGPSLLIAPMTAPGEWYKGLRKPAWTPPGWLFGPVWVALYLTMSVAMWLVWKDAPEACQLPLRLYAIQLLLNHAWSPVFFGLKRPGAAMVVIAAMWLAILTTIISFALRVPLAAQLMLPYLAWVSFASALNYRLWRDNPRDSL